jgi:hypothetical protein
VKCCCVVCTAIWLLLIAAIEMALKFKERGSEIDDIEIHSSKCQQNEAREWL